MVIIYGHSRRAALCFGYASVLALVALVLVITDTRPAMIARQPWPESAPVSRETFVAIMAVVVPLLILMSALAFALAAFGALRFAVSGAALVMTADGLHFPVLPGLKSGRSIDWSDVYSISPFEHSCPKNLKGLVAIGKAIVGGPVQFRIDLARSHKQACRHSSPLGVVYWLDRVRHARAIGPNAAVQGFFANGLSPRQTLAVMNSMHRDPETRKKYGAYGETYVVLPGSGDEVRFEPLEGLSVHDHR